MIFYLYYYLIYDFPILLLILDIYLYLLDFIYLINNPHLNNLNKRNFDKMDILQFLSISFF